MTVLTCRKYSLQNENNEIYYLFDQKIISFAKYWFFFIELFLFLFCFIILCLKFIKRESQLLINKIKIYLSDFLNTVQIIAFILFFIGIIFRFIPNYNCYITGRILLCIDILFWYNRSLYAYKYFRTLGPKILMIRQIVMIFKLIRIKIYFLNLQYFRYFKYSISCCWFWFLFSLLAFALKPWCFIIRNLV